MTKQIRSKFIGNHYGKWTVERASRTIDGHLRFTLTRMTSDGAHKYLTLRDNELTKIDRKERTVESYVKGKEFVKKQFKSNIFRNNIFYTFEPRTTAKK